MFNNALNYQHHFYDTLRFKIAKGRILVLWSLYFVCFQKSKKAFNLFNLYFSSFQIFIQFGFQYKIHKSRNLIFAKVFGLNNFLFTTFKYHLYNFKINHFLLQFSAKKNENNTLLVLKCIYQRSQNLFYACFVNNVCSCVIVSKFNAFKGCFVITRK